MAQPNGRDSADIQNMRPADCTDTVTLNKIQGVA